MNKAGELRIAVIKDKLNDVFKELRKKPYNMVARQNYACCMSCACAEIGGYLDDNPSKNFKGAVYYHSQDNDRRKEGGDFMLRYFGNDDMEGGIDSMGVALALIGLLKAYDIEYEWSGSTSEAITIVQTYKYKNL